MRGQLRHQAPQAPLVRDHLHQHTLPALIALLYGGRGGGGVIGRHWKAWQDARPESCTVKVLLSEYHISFHHPPITEFSSYGLGFLKAQLLQEMDWEICQTGAYLFTVGCILQP